MAEGEDSATGPSSRAYDREVVERYLTEHSWKQLDHALGNFVDEVFHAALVPSKDSTGTKKKKHKKLYNESSVYCATWKGMMDTILMDKSVRKVNQLSSL